MVSSHCPVQVLKSQCKLTERIVLAALPRVSIEVTNRTFTYACKIRTARASIEVADMAAFFSKFLAVLLAVL